MIKEVMNERIKEIAEQATIIGESGYPDSKFKYFDKEKFAQLLIRECVKVMYDNAIERKVLPDINQTPTHYAIAILEHFGVTHD